MRFIDADALSTDLRSLAGQQTDFANEIIYLTAAKLVEEYADKNAIGKNEAENKRNGKQVIKWI